MIKVDDKFWILVQTTPDRLEALDLVRRAKSQLITELAVNQYREDTQQHQLIMASVSRLNVEIDLLSRLLQITQWSRAVKTVCGADAHAACVEWLNRNYPDRKSREK